jgi:hypothetical protein
MVLSPASLQKAITRHRPWQMMHMKWGLCFSTDITKEQTTLNPTFPTGRLLGRKRLVWRCGGKGWKISAEGKVLWEMILVILSVTLLSPTHRSTSANDGATSSGFKNTAFYPQPQFISIVRPQKKQRLFLSKALTGLYNREGVCLLRGTDWIF